MLTRSVVGHACAVNDLDELTDWLTVPEAAEHLGVDVVAVRRLIQDHIGFKYGICVVPEKFSP